MTSEGSEDDTVTRYLNTNKRNSSLKVTHYPILLLKKNNYQNATLKWTPGDKLPESCSGASTWIIDESTMDSLSTTESNRQQQPTTSSDDYPINQNNYDIKDDDDLTLFNGEKRRHLSGDEIVNPKRRASEYSHDTRINCRDKFFGAKNLLGPRNTIAYGAETNHSQSELINDNKDTINDVNNSNNTIMLHPQHKYSLGVYPNTNINNDALCSESLLSVQTSKNNNKNRKQLWTLNPTSFHQSFDDRVSGINILSNSCGNINEQVNLTPQRHGPSYRRRAAFCSGDTSKGVFAGGYGSGHNSANTYSGVAYSPGSSRPPALGGRSPQSSFESNGDVGQISINFMRVNGGYAPFKNILTKDHQKSTTQNESKDLNVACNQAGIGPTTTTVPSQNDSLARVGSCHTPFNAEQYRRKESWSHNYYPGRKTSDPIRISIDAGEQHSKKSLSLMISEDLENGKGGNDDSKTPLMKEQEKTGRLIHRQKLFISRRDTADWALIFAVIGIILMVIETELHVNDVYLKRSTASIVLRTIIMLSTIALIGTVIKFHVHEVELFMNANSAEDWRIALTFKRCSQIALELLICSICPLPLDISFTWDTLRHDGKAITRTTIQLDALLSIPMFFRLYWLFRVMLLHSKLFTDASSRSIAGLNRVAFNAKFILKTLMTLCPGIIMLVFTASLWIIAAWVLRLCEHHQTGDPTNYHAIKQQNYLNSLWMIAITFLSVGYGDIVPTTICGRGVAVVTGILGTCTSSMVVAVIARKLELSRAEKHVHNFMIDTKLTKELKHSAANVLRETWLIYKYRRLVDKIDPGKIRHHQRKFLMAIYALRKVKREQRQLAENSVSLGDVAKTTSNSYELIHDIHSTQDGLALRMTAVEHQLSDIQREIGQLADLFKTVVSNQNIVNIRRESGTDISPKRESVRKRNKYGDL